MAFPRLAILASLPCEWSVIPAALHNERVGSAMTSISLRAGGVEGVRRMPAQVVPLFHRPH